jgi:hypothetical protein
MSTFDQRQNSARKHAAVSASQSDPTPCRYPSAWHFSGSQREFLGNQALQRMLNSRAIQPKLKIISAHDSYEQEADRVADQVMRMPEPRLQRQEAPEQEEEEEEEEVLQAKPFVQRQDELEDEELLQTKPLLQRRVNDGRGVPSETPAIVHNVLRSPGRPLDPATRAFMEPRFGHDFSQVKLHTDERASQSARALNARAFTAGQDITFGAGEYTPETASGRRLLAHELTHVVQQAQGVVQELGRVEVTRQDAGVLEQSHNRRLNFSYMDVRPSGASSMYLPAVQETTGIGRPMAWRGGSCADVTRRPSYACETHGASCRALTAAPQSAGKGTARRATDGCAEGGMAKVTALVTSRPVAVIQREPKPDGPVATPEPPINYMPMPNPELVLPMPELPVWVTEDLKLKLTATVMAESAPGQENDVMWIYINRVDQAGGEMGLEGSAAYTGKGERYRTYLYALGDKTYGQTMRNDGQTVAQYVASNQWFRSQKLPEVQALKSRIDSAITGGEGNPYANWTGQGSLKDFNNESNDDIYWKRARAYFFLQRDEGLQPVYVKELPPKVKGGLITFIFHADAIRAYFDAHPNKLPAEVPKYHPPGR